MWCKQELEDVLFVLDAEILMCQLTPQIVVPMFKNCVCVARAPASCTFDSRGRFGSCAMFAALDLASSNGDAMDLDNDTSGQSTRGHLLLTCGDPSSHPKLLRPCLIIASACM